MFLIKAAQLILSLSLLVVVHELGHFMFAKLFKARVESFYLFFNPWFSLFKKKIGETEYGIGWVPFGGYVKISGMIDESMDKEQMAQPPKPYEFRSKPAWQRLLIMIGGVMMNILMAFAIYIGVTYAYGESYLANSDVKDGYAYSELAQKIGFENGDKIISVGGETYQKQSQIASAIIVGAEQQVVVERDGKEHTINIGEEYVADILKGGMNFLQLRMPYVVDSLQQDGGAAMGGMLKGDSVIMAAGVSGKYLDEFIPVFTQNSGKTIDITVVRDSAGVNITKQLPVMVSTEGKIGTVIDGVRALSTYKITEANYSLMESIPIGINRTIAMVVNYIQQIKLIFNPQTEAYKSVGSVVSMGSIFPATWNWEAFWNITAFFSVILAVMNMLPIPALDGGHVLFLLYEVITRRKPSDKFMEYATTVGVGLLLLLMVFALGNDIYKLF